MKRQFFRTVGWIWAAGWALSILAAAEPLPEKRDLFELSIEELMEIPVFSSASLTKTKPRLVPAAVTTITQEEIAASGARNLFELLDIYVPNFQWIRHHWEPDHMGLRGIMSDHKYLLLVNGRNMNHRTHVGALSERDLVLLSDIHRIDIIRGPGSALYGPGAVSMVINIITHNPSTFEGTEIITRAGAGEEFYSIEIKQGRPFSDGDGGYFWYAGIGKYLGAKSDKAQQIFPLDFPQEMDVPWWDNEPWPDGWGPNPANPPRLPTDGLKAGQPLTQGPISRDGASYRGLPPVKLHFHFQKDNWDIWARYTRGGKDYVMSPQIWARPSWGYADYVFYSFDWDTWTGTYKKVRTNTYGYQQGTVYIGYTQELTDSLSLQYAFSYDTFHLVQRRQNWVDEASREDEYYGKAVVQWQPHDKHRFAFGGELSHQELGLKAHGWPDIPPTSPRLPSMPRWSTNLYSIFGEYQWTLTDRWTVFLGGRADDHTYTERMYSPRAAVVYSPTDHDTVKLMWSRSVRANIETEMRASAMAGSGNSAPEKLDSVELRWEKKHSKNLETALTGFVHYSLELLGWNVEQSRVTPVGNQREYGIEFETAYQTSTTQVVFSHAYTQLYDFDLVEGSRTYVTAEPYGYGRDLADWSDHVSKIAWRQKLSEQLTLDASLRIYWGFPGMKDYNEYYPYAFDGARRSFEYDGTTYPDGRPFPEHRFFEPGWKKSYRGNYYLNVGLQYKPSKNLTIGIHGYNLLGIFDKNLNKRNYLAVYGDYRTHAPAAAVSISYRW